MSTPLLIVVVAVVAFVAIRQQGLNRRLRAELDRLTGDIEDSRTTLLTSAALPLRLQPELDWARLRQQPLALAVYDVFTRSPDDAARRLRSRMRGEENGYLLGENRFMVALWGVDRHKALLGTARLGSALLADDCRVVDAGVAFYPDDGSDVDVLVECATSRSRPIQDFVDYMGARSS